MDGIYRFKIKKVMEMISQKNKDIKKAYDLLKVLSQDEKSRYEGIV